jgi:NAD(P)-dependent dehydrogenase (short-subunit alcohol dehydrogenase family)
MDLDLRGRAYVVTGGTRGIGRAVAELLVAEEASVAICGRDAAACGEVAAALGPRAHGIDADVSNGDASARLVEQALARFGRLDGIVNNAGRFGGGPLEALPRELLEDGLATKVVGPIALVQAALPALRESDRPAVVNLSGVTAQNVTPGAAVTAISNAGVVALTSYLARELQPDAIRVNCVIPGYTSTEVWNDRAAALAEREGIDDEAARAAILARQNMGHARWGRPEEIATAIVWLLSGAASFVNGIALRVDGGQLAAVDL